MVLVEGAAGMGKTLLGAWLHEEALTRGIAPLLGAADVTTRTDPYRAWADVFAQLLEVGRFDLPEEAREEVRLQLAGDEGFDAWAPLLEPLLRVGFEPNEITASMPGAAAADTLRRMLLHLLEQGSATSPRLVLLDDAQWMSPSSWELVAAAMARIPQLLIVVFARPPEGEGARPPEWADLVASEAGWELVLRGLDDDDLQELVLRRLAADEVPPSVAQAVLGRAEGNPYFAEELVWALLDSGQVVVEGGVCQALDERSLRTLDLPDTLQGVVTARLDRLDPQDALTAKIASVLGREFRWDELRAIHPVESTDQTLRDQLDRLCADAILTHEPGDPGWTFRSLVLHESAYGLLPFTRRRALHRAVAEWYEASSSDLSRFYPLLAHHWRGAEEFDRALGCLESAEFIVSRLGAHREGLELLKTAFEVADAAEARGRGVGPDRRHDWTGRMGSNHHGLGNMVEAQAYLREASINLGVAVPTSTAGWVLRTLFEVFVQARNVLLPFLRRDARDDADRERLLSAARHTSMYGNTCYFTVEPLKWFALSLIGVNLGERAADDRPASEGLSSLGNIAGTLKLDRLAAGYFERARRTEDATALTVADWAEAVVHLTFCRWEPFHTVLDAGLELGQRVGDRGTREVGLAIQGIGAWLHGTPAQAVAATAECLISARERGNVEHVSWGLTFSAPALLALGDGARLRAHLTEATQLLEGFDPFTRIVYEGVRAQCLGRDGDVDGSVEAAAELVRRFGDHSLTMYTYLPAFGGAVEAVFGALHAQQGGRAVAVPEGCTLDGLARTLVKALKTHARTFHYFKPRAALAAGTLAWLSGKPAVATARWTQAQTLAAELGLPYESALVDLERARWLPASEAGEAIGRARGGLRALGASGDLARLDSWTAAGEDEISASA